MKIQNRGTGAGGFRTTLNGGSFELKTSNEPYLLEHGFIRKSMDGSILEGNRFEYIPCECTSNEKTKRRDDVLAQLIKNKWDVSNLSKVVSWLAKQTKSGIIIPDCVPTFHYYLEKQRDYGTILYSSQTNAQKFFKLPYKPDAAYLRLCLPGLRP